MLSTNGTENKDKADIPLCIDLDGTLLKTDLFLETLILNIKQRPILFFIIPWLICRHGVSYVKHLLSARISPRMDTLPLNRKVLDLIHREKRKNRAVYLVTAACSSQAQAVADRMGIFTDVFSSGKNSNLKSSSKRDFLLSLFSQL